MWNKFGIDYVSRPATQGVVKKRDKIEIQCLPAIALMEFNGKA